MIPPLPDLRLRSITRWLKESSPQEFSLPSQAAALVARAENLDEQMIEAETENALRLRTMQTKSWGDEPALQEYRTELLQIWQRIVSDFLPAISEPQ